MAINTEIICTLDFLANGIPSASHTYTSADGNVVSSEVVGDIDSSPAQAREMMDELDRWHRMLDVMCDLDTSLTYDVLDVAEITKVGDDVKLVVNVEGAEYEYQYTAATGVLVIKARDEATLSYAAFRFLRKEIGDFLAILP